MRRGRSRARSSRGRRGRPRRSASRRPSRPSEPSARVRSRTRSGRISVFWWPTALWFVSGATTVTSPIASSACFSASSPRDSTPSSLVTRIFGWLVHSPSGRACLRSARGPPRAAPPASGSPRSLSRSRRSVRARSRVMSGWSVARLGGPWSLSLTAVAWPRPASGGSPDPRARLTRRRVHRGPARRCRSRCPGSVRAGCGPVARHVPRDALPPCPRPSGPPRSDAGTRAGTPRRRRRSGSRRSRRGCPAIRLPIRTEPRTTIGWMPTAPCMIRGWRTFITTSQPAPIRITAGSDRLRLEDEGDDDRRRPGDERPEERDHLEQTGQHRGQGGEGQPQQQVRAERHQEVDAPIRAWPRRKPPNERETDVSSRRASSA